MAFYISGPKLLFETTEISTHPNSTQQESNYIYLYTTKFGTSKKIRLNRKFESTEFETMRVNCSSASIYNQTSFSHCLVSMVFVVGALNKNLLKPLDPIKADLVGMVLVFSTLYQTDPLSWDDTWVVPFQLCIRQTRPPSKTKKESYYKQIYL